MRPRRCGAKAQRLDLGGLGGDVGRVALQQNPGVRAVPQDAARPVQQVERCERIAVAFEPLRRWGHGQRSQDHLGQQTEGAQ